MRDLNIVDVEMNNEVHLDESEVLVTLDSGGLSGSPIPHISLNHASSNKNSDEKNAYSNNSTSSSEEINGHSIFPPPPLVQVPVVCNTENRGEKEKSSVPFQNGVLRSSDSNLSSMDQSYNAKNSSNNSNAVDNELREQSGNETSQTAQVRPKIVTSINDFKILKVLGKGAYGKVYQVRKVSGPGSGHIYAMKAMNKSRICGSKTDVRHTKAERDVLVAVHEEQNPFIVKLHFAFETERRLYLVQEFCCGGELFRRMEFERLMLEKDAIFYLSEIVIALEYLHSKGIVYRDLKTENVMLDKKGHVKLIDFGLSKMNMGDDTLTSTFCGTVEYMAPEVILRSSGYGKPADWWSLGIFTFDLLTGRSPFHSNQGKAATKERILRGKFPTPKILTPEAGDFVRRLLRKPVPKRLGTQGAWEVKSHGLFKDLDWDMVINKEYKPPFEPFVVDDTDVQHFDEQFTSRSPRESNETPPNHKKDDSNKSKPVVDYTTAFEDFDYVSEEFNQEDVTTSTNMDSENHEMENNINHYKNTSDDIDTDPVDSDDNSSFIVVKCLKCQLQLNIKNNRSNSNSGDENKTVEDLKDLRICSHGS